MKDSEEIPEDSLDDRLRRADRQIRRNQLREQIQEMGGLIGGSDGDKVSDLGLSFLEHVMAWEIGPRSSHRDWLARHGQMFIPSAELAGRRLKTELWRLIQALAGARVFLYHTDHLGEAELYGRLWTEVLPSECPDGARTKDDACHWDFADAGSGGEEIWLRFHASVKERENWSVDFPETVLPERCRPPYHRDHRLPVRN